MIDPKEAAKLIDDMEAIQADMHSGDGRLQLYALGNMITLSRELAGKCDERSLVQRRVAQLLMASAEKMEATYNDIGERQAAALRKDIRNTWGGMLRRMDQREDLLRDRDDADGQPTLFEIEPDHRRKAK